MVNKKTLYLISGVLLLLSFVKILMSAKLATTGVELTQIANQSQSLTGQNCQYEELITETSSFQRISSEAVKLGLGPSKKVVSLVSEVPIALR